MTLVGTNICLRALEPEDLGFLYQVENNQEFWSVSDTIAPYSKAVLKTYLADSQRSIYDSRQLRLVICLKESLDPIGFVDLFDFDPRHRKAGLGIVISEEGQRQKGRAKEAINLVVQYGFRHLELHQLYAYVAVDNAPSVGLFESLGFKCSGELKSWWKIPDGFADLYVYQKMRPLS
ncbi:MAG: GNAT family N-acetyltransferase [Flavobacteriaceae bacterium]|nr:GNAT family N-acetyltransferase [Flavobacteriaceae bacterium]MDG1961877.1 GNAT family N-acetyltransferase [Flavobacteriaceae bacterium]